MSQNNSVLALLLHRGDVVAIVNGKVIIESASGLPVPDEYIDKNGRDIMIDAINSMGVKAYRYTSYKTGSYGDHMAGGITLQFANIITGETAYTCFNVNLKTIRKTKQKKVGSDLPTGQFSVTKRMSFNKFWCESGLPQPKSLTRFHRCMGKLKSVIYTAQVDRYEKLDKTTIRPLNISYAQLKLGHSLDISRTQGGHKEGISAGHKESTPAQPNYGLAPNQSACDTKYGNKVIREHGNTGSVSSISKAPIDQTVDEWLNDYINHEPFSDIK
jgi:hypothetical protein